MFLKRKVWKQHDKTNYSCYSLYFKFVEGKTKKTTTVIENANEFIYLTDKETNKWATLPHVSLTGTIYDFYVLESSLWLCQLRIEVCTLEKPGWILSPHPVG